MSGADIELEIVIDSPPYLTIRSLSARTSVSVDQVSTLLIGASWDPLNEGAYATGSAMTRLCLLLSLVDG